MVSVHFARMTRNYLPVHTVATGRLPSSKLPVSWFDKLNLLKVPLRASVEHDADAIGAREDQVQLVVMVDVRRHDRARRRAGRECQRLASPWQVFRPRKNGYCTICIRYGQTIGLHAGSELSVNDCCGHRTHGISARMTKGASSGVIQYRDG